MCIERAYTHAHAQLGYDIYVHASQYGRDATIHVNRRLSNKISGYHIYGISYLHGRRSSTHRRYMSR